MIQRLAYSVICLLFVTQSYASELKFYHIQAHDGVNLRVGVMLAKIPNPERKVIYLIPGRASFIEKQIENINDFADRGFDVWVLDLRGQGGSSRLLDHQQKNHIADFAAYIKDIDQILEEVILPTHPGSIIMLGASLGGHLALRYMQEFPGKVDGAILAAPMLDIHTKPVPKFIAKPVLKLINFLGYGESYAFGHGDFTPKKGYFEQNKTTHDRRRYERSHGLTITRPELVTGGVTFGWALAALQSIDKTKQNGYLESIKEPILIVNGDQDVVVDNSSDHVFCERAKNCRLKTLVGAKHNVLNEIDSLRNQFFKAADDMLLEIEKSSVFDKKIAGN